ncbi:hypothetical protein ACFY9A_37835 [Streptomyces rubradiris]|uniref:hypothetical protein n=1 Tax=Streptomyces rubradiris TaxID=285531 RepID=UPI0036E63FFB
MADEDVHLVAGPREAGDALRSEPHVGELGTDSVRLGLPQAGVSRGEGGHGLFEGTGRDGQGGVFGHGWAFLLGGDRGCVQARNGGPMRFAW